MLTQKQENREGTPNRRGWILVSFLNQPGLWPGNRYGDLVEDFGEDPVDVIDDALSPHGEERLLDAGESSVLPAGKDHAGAFRVHGGTPLAGIRVALRYGDPTSKTASPMGSDIKKMP